MHDELRRKRDATVREHMESENRHDFEATIGTFSHPRYEICATGDVYDGEEEVRAYFAETRRAARTDRHAARPPAHDRPRRGPAAQPPLRLVLRPAGTRCGRLNGQHLACS